MIHLQTRLKSLLVAGRKTSEEFNQWVEEDVLPSGHIVQPGAVYSHLLSDRLVIGPSNVLERPNVSFVSSRLPRNPGTHPEWFCYLRTGLIGASRDGRTVFSARGTTCDRYLDAAKSTLNLRFCRITEIEDKGDDGSWIPGLAAMANTESVLVTPALSTGKQSSRLEPDMLLLSIAQQTRVIKVNRKGGTRNRVVNALGPERARSNQLETTVLVASHPRLVAPEILNRLLEQGAVAWQVDGAEYEESNHPLPKTSAPWNITPLSRFKDSCSFLFHCTRAPDGPWPDQTENEYLTEQVFEYPGPRTPLNALARMIEQRTIIATSNLNRADTSVVCFTSAGLQELRDMRVFRPHLARWDFEPYGIGIRRDAARNILGAGVVQYGTDSEFKSLDANRRPWFQLSSTRTKSGNIIDWTREKEWRVVGNVDLTRIPRDDCLVFVPSLDDANWISSICPYRIIVLDQPDATKSHSIHSG